MSKKITDEKELREAIRSIVTKMMEAKSETMSGMSKVKETHKQTEPAKGVKAPKTTKVTKDSPPASVTATSEVKPDDNGVEIKTMKGKDKELPKKDSENFEIEVDGLKFKVRGASHADVNYTILIGQIKKALEGKGKYITSIDIKLGDKKDIVEEQVRHTVREELKKFLFN